MEFFADMVAREGWLITALFAGVVGVPVVYMALIILAPILIHVTGIILAVTGKLQGGWNFGLGRKP